MIVKTEINVKEMCCFGFHCSKVNFSLKEMKIKGDWLKLTLGSRAHLLGKCKPGGEGSHSSKEGAPAGGIHHTHAHTRTPFFFFSFLNPLTCACLLEACGWGLEGGGYSDQSWLDHSTLGMRDELWFSAQFWGQALGLTHSSVAWGSFHKPRYR